MAAASAPPHRRPRHEPASDPAEQTEREREVAKQHDAGVGVGDDRELKTGTIVCLDDFTDETVTVTSAHHQS